MRSPSYSTKPSFLIAVLFLLAVTAMPPVRTASAQGPWSWVTFKPPGESFSVRMPKQPSQEPVEMPNAPNLTGTSYSATGGGIYFTVKSIRAGRGGSRQSRLNDFIARYRGALSPSARLTDERIVNLGGFGGRQYRINSTSVRGLVRFYSTELSIYVLEVAGGDEEDVPVGWFLSSFTINEPPPIPDREDDGTGGPSEDRNRRPTYEQCACDASGNPVDQAVTEARLTREAIICTEGNLRLPPQAIKHQFNGDVILEIEFLKDGTVGEIKVIQPQPYGLTQVAVEAARLYKFCPALQDGQPVDQITTLTATFSVTVEPSGTQRPGRRPRGRRRP
ncbi:MAG: energy transducer TonB [Pyrinomonadaceae bacterium]